MISVVVVDEVAIGEDAVLTSIRLQKLRICAACVVVLSWLSCRLPSRLLDAGLLILVIERIVVVDFECSNDEQK